MTHCRSDSEASSWLWMSGSATFTIVMSSSSMNTPVHTAVSVHHFGSRRLPVGAAYSLMAASLPSCAADPDPRLRPLRLDLAAQPQHGRPVGLLDLVRRVLGRAEPLD